MHTNCLNCNSTLQHDQAFCSVCGQKADIHRFNMAHFGHELAHAFTHADKGIFHLIKALTINPGKVLKEYIIEGKRRKYFNPFTFLLIIAGTSLIVTLYFKPYSRNKKTDAQIELEGKARNASALDIKVAKRTMQMNDFIEKNVKVILFASVPVSAFIFFIFYRKTGINFAEHLVACLFITGYLSVVMTLFTPIQAMVSNGKELFLVTTATLLFQWIYFAQSYFGFMKEYGHTKLRAYIASIANIIIWTVVSTVLISIYFFL